MFEAGPRRGRLRPAEKGQRSVAILRRSDTDVENPFKSDVGIFDQSLLFEHLSLLNNWQTLLKLRTRSPYYIRNDLYIFFFKLNRCIRTLRDEYKIKLNVSH